MSGGETEGERDSPSGPPAERDVMIDDVQVRPREGEEVGVEDEGAKIRKGEETVGEAVLEKVKKHDR